MSWLLKTLNKVIRWIAGYRDGECWHSWEWNGRKNRHNLESRKCRHCGKIEVSVYSGGVIDGGYVWATEDEVKSRW